MSSVKLFSEQQHLKALRSQLGDGEFEVYKACVAVANNGITLPEESTLTDAEKNLLEVRRKIFEGDFIKAQQILAKTVTTNILLQGDLFFLLAQVCHRKGDQIRAADYCNKAANEYKKLNDLHRELRARVNGALCLSTLESCICGELHAFEQVARQANFRDIAANIVRTRALELLANGKTFEAYVQAMEASSLYQLDGYRDDRDVATILASICLLLMGEIMQAKTLRAEALISEGKVAVYADAFEAILSGKIPKSPPGHPLSKIKWKKINLKTESVSGKIISALKKGPQTKETLILEVWGQEALSDSYTKRLYSAINTIRKERSHIIIFDGEFYKIV